MIFHESPRLALGRLSPLGPHSPLARLVKRLQRCLRKFTAKGLTLKSVLVTGQNRIDWVEVEEPTVGPNDVLLKMKACGICGADAMYAMYGGIPPRQGVAP